MSGSVSTTVGENVGKMSVVLLVATILHLEAAQSQHWSVWYMIIYSVKRKFVVVMFSLCLLFWWDSISAYNYVYILLITRSSISQAFIVWKYWDCVYILLITRSSISQAFRVWQCWDCFEDFWLYPYGNRISLIAEISTD